MAAMAAITKLAGSGAAETTLCTSDLPPCSCTALSQKSLSVFVLLSQNRQAAKDRVHADIEYDVNLKAELEIAHLREKIDRLTCDVLMRLDRVHRLLPANADLNVATAELSSLNSPGNER